MRDDFTLFDAYEHVPAPGKIPVPINAFFAEQDQVSCMMLAYVLHPIMYAVCRMISTLRPPRSTLHPPPSTLHTQLCTVNYVLLTTYYLLLTTCYLLLAICYLLLTKYYLLPTTYYLLLTAAMSLTSPTTPSD